MSKDYIARPTRKRAPSFKSELKVLAVLALFIAALELTSRWIAPVLDYDRVHIQQFPQITEEFQQQNELVPKVLFLGNSLILHGLDLEKTQSKYDDSGLLTTAKLSPVGTAITDWTYLFKRYIDEEKSQPNVVVMGFVNHHISDDYTLKIRRLGRHFVAQQDLPHIWKNELHDFHRCAQTTLSHYSSLMGDQPEHQLYILDYCISNYKAGVRLNNDIIDSLNQRRAEQLISKTVTTPQASNFERIRRFSALMKERGIELWFVPMPQPEFYTLHNGCEEVLEECGIKLVDARSIPGMTPEDFSDGYHLGKTGTEKFTAWMHQQLDAYLSR